MTAKNFRQFHLFPLDGLDNCFSSDRTVILLESGRPDAENQHSYLFANPLLELQASSLQEIPRLFRDLERWRHSHWIAGYLSYESAPGLGVGTTERHAGDALLAWFGVFERPAVYRHSDGTWENPPLFSSSATGQTPLPAGHYTPLIEQSEYADAYRQIQDYLVAGDTYQVNYTFDGRFDSSLPTFQLYRQLRSLQRVPYSALIQHRGRSVLSFSPELFFRTDGRHITTRPMKGTSTRGPTLASDRRRQRALATDVKNRAENLMIVDLLRNDLGRVCTTGTVHVPRLFEVEAHRTVLQMTSTITGELQPGWTLQNLFTALFPCGSVTGAPKLRTMEIIAELESAPRGVYCGAIGYCAPSGKSVFSVPIRTLERTADADHWHYHTGSGVVHGAEAEEEWRECLAKTAFLTAPGPSFQLVETLRLYDGSIDEENAHRRRMAASARYWGYPFARNGWDQVMDAVCTSHPQGAQMVRVLLDEDGRFTWEAVSIDATPWPELPAPIRLRPNPMDPANPFLYHKTTYRPWYAETLKRIRRGEVFDEIYINNRGELTEGGRTNLFARLEGRLYTPPLRAGLLPGVLRAQLIRTGQCRERLLRPGDLMRAEALFCGNSVRGLVPVRLVEK